MSWVITGSQKVNWDPSLISTALWLDANDFITITQSSNLVSQWNDKSGNARHATASTTARPTYGATSFNSKPGLTFDGTANVLRADSLATIAQGDDSPWSAIFACSVPSSATNRTLFAFGSSGISDFFHSAFLNTSNNLILRRREILGSDADATAVFPTGTPLVYATVFSGTTSTFFENGTQSATATTNTPTFGGNPNQFAIGALARDTIGTFGTPTFGELIITSGALSTTNRQKTEGYLAHKWGLTANLPADHPYKVNPPAP
jgi:hypothetical protein